MPTDNDARAELRLANEHRAATLSASSPTLIGG